MRKCATVLALVLVVSLVALGGCSGETEGTIAESSTEESLIESSGLLGTWVADSGDLLTYNADGTKTFVLHDKWGGLEPYSRGVWRVEEEDGQLKIIGYDTHGRAPYVDDELAFASGVMYEIFGGTEDGVSLSGEAAELYEEAQATVQRVVSAGGTETFLDHKGVEHIVEGRELEAPKLELSSFVVVDGDTLTFYENAADAESGVNATEVYERTTQ